MTRALSTIWGETTLTSPQSPTANDLAIDLIAALGPDSEARMTHEDHAYWLEVGKALGPAHIKALRHVAAFMAKMEEF